MDFRKLKIITLGCKVNQYESASLAESLGRVGFKKAMDNQEADLVVINTCIVTQRASYQSRQAVRKAIRENPSAKIAAVGCYGQVFPHEIEEIEGVDLVLDNQKKLSLASYIQDNIESPLLISGPFEDGLDFEFAPVSNFSNRTRAFLKIQDGCESFCSYCIVPYARGPIRSLDSDRVIGELERLSRGGYKEVVLTGIHLGAYGQEPGRGINLKSLLNRIDKHHIDLRIRLSSIEPQEIDGELIGMVSHFPWLCRHFHIPLQSGDDQILAKMNRRYSSQYFIDLVKKIHEQEPLAAIGVDVMVGFPGENDQAFRNNHDLINNLPISYLHVFPFSPRNGTPAASFPDQVESRVIKERAAYLRELGQKKREDFYRSCLGKPFRVLTEGKWDENGYAKGFTDNYVRVAFPSRELANNRMVEVMAEKIERGYIKAKER
jgi:threonylcarbamoyladenosine tRNA methylthiotransferase MtaB